MSDAGSTLEANIDRLLAATADVRAAVREAHEVIADLRAVRRDASTVLAEIERRIDAGVKARLEEAVAAALAELGEVTAAAIVKAEAGVMRRFDELGDILLGEDKATRRAGKASLPDLARQRAVARAEVERAGLVDVERDVFRSGPLL